MSPKNAAAPRMLALAVAAAAGAAGAYVAVASRSDAMLSSSFEAALADRHAAQHIRPAAQVPLAATEGFWLSSLAKAEGGATPVLLKDVAAGDRISFALADGKSQQLEVVDVRSVGGEATRLEAPGAGRMLLVSARVVGDPGQRMVRFIIESDVARPADSAGRQHRSL